MPITKLFFGHLKSRKKDDNSMISKGEKEIIAIDSLTGITRNVNVNVSEAFAKQRPIKKYKPFLDCDPYT